jgi:hypothetical protein
MHPYNEQEHRRRLEDMIAVRQVEHNEAVLSARQAEEPLTRRDESSMSSSDVDDDDDVSTA